jgi:hypothetical protein
MSSYYASSHFTHTLSLPSHTTLLNMHHYLIPAWNERPFCRCGQRVKLTTSLVPSTYGRRCFMCLDIDPSGVVGFSISILYIDDCTYISTTNMDILISAFLVWLLWMDWWVKVEPYEDMCHNYEADQNSCQKRRGKDLIWCTRLERQEYNLNQRARELDIGEAHVRRHERWCDRHEAEVHVARLSGNGRGSTSGSEQLE